ncbi:peroxiredoxin [Candidatus Parcubacteria bacterium]|nr:MAG: peroxiredoxin [Candidatus Parcubacteria bacterium]
MENETRQGLPLLGEAIPEMEVVTTHGVKNIPGDYKGKWLVLFSHPADFTPVCTTEFVAFNRRYDEFQKLNTELLGLSIDQVFSHIKWTQWIKDNLDEEIKFPIIADDMGNVAKQLGMVHPGKGTNTVRAVFIIDAKGLLRTVMYYPQEIGRNMDEILRAIKALQLSDEKGVAVPAGWPNNELISDEVIIPPAKTEEDAEKRKGQDGCYDWWFCHKKAD